MVAVVMVVLVIRLELDHLVHLEVSVSMLIAQ
jgi:hypothetical protein